MVLLVLGTAVAVAWWRWRIPTCPLHPCKVIRRPRQPRVPDVSRQILHHCRRHRNHRPNHPSWQRRQEPIRHRPHHEMPGTTPLCTEWVSEEMKPFWMSRLPWNNNEKRNHEIFSAFEIVKTKNLRRRLDSNHHPGQRPWRQPRDPFHHLPEVVWAWE